MIYHIKLFLKRFKLKKLFNKYFSFALGENITIVNFAMFVDFYENGNIDIINWGIDNKHIEAKKIIDSIYFYITYLKPKYLKILDKLLDRWQYETIYTKAEDGYVELTFKDLGKYNEKIIDTHNRIDSLLYEWDKKYLYKMIDVKDYLWI